MFNFKNEKDKANFMYALEKTHNSYDPEVKMLKSTISSPGYHTLLSEGEIHHTRGSFSYAVALFDSGIRENIDRGREIALKVAALQDKDENSRTYGIWSWYYEEPLDKMGAPDWNWADFCGKEILQILKDHKEHLSDRDYDYLKTTVYHACKSIMRRNMGPHYTNIAIMGTYVTHVAGELLGFTEVLEYAKKRLANFLEYSKKNNNFTEYNSPTYTLLAAEDLGWMYRDVKDEESKRLIYECMRIAWRTILMHQHIPTGQWAGPHRRNYTELIRPETQAKIQHALDGKICFLTEDEMKEHINTGTYRIDLKCPEEFIKDYLKNDDEKTIFERFSGEKGSTASTFKSAGTANSDSAEICFTYMNKNFTIGSCYRDTTWNQKRNQLLYFGTKDSPFCFRPTLLHDFYDYASGVLINVQHKGLSVGALGFATDAGDTHPNLDMVKDGTIRVSDIRLRFSLYGDISRLGPHRIIDPPGFIGTGQNRDAHTTSVHGGSLDGAKGPGFEFTIGPVTVRLDIPFAVFEDYPLSYGITKEKGALHFDTILFSGRSRSLDFRAVNRACLGFTLDITDKNSAPAKSSAFINGDFLEVCLAGEKKILATIPVKPGLIGEMYSSSRGEIDGKNVNDLV